jgi:hypothetical protein
MGGTAIIIKNNIRHHELDNCKNDFLQATTVEIEDWSGSILVSSVYCLSKRIISNEQFEIFFETLDVCFIAVGDYNAKHQYWGSKLANPKGRALHKTIINKRLNIIS